jgi:transposase
VDTRCRRWTLAGVWDRIFAAVQRQADAAGQLDWEVHFVDGTLVRAHQHAVGAKEEIWKRKRSAGVRAAARRRSISGRRAAASR